MSITRWKITTMADLRFATKGIADTTPVEWRLPPEMDHADLMEQLSAIVADLIAEIHWAGKPEHAHFVSIGQAFPSTPQEPQP